MAECARNGNASGNRHTRRLCRGLSASFSRNVSGKHFIFLMAVGLRLLRESTSLRREEGRRQS